MQLRVRAYISLSFCMLFVRLQSVVAISDWWVRWARRIEHRWKAEYARWRKGSNFSAVAQQTLKSTIIFILLASHAICLKRAPPFQSSTTNPYRTPDTRTKQRGYYKFLWIPTILHFMAAVSSRNSGFIPYLRNISLIGREFSSLLSR